MARQCSLCDGLAQANSHFDAEWWEAVKVSAQERIREAQREIDRAELHLAQPRRLAAAR